MTRPIIQTLSGRSLRIVSPNRRYEKTNFHPGLQGSISYIGTLVIEPKNIKDAGFYCNTPWGIGFVTVLENAGRPLPIIPLPPPESVIVLDQSDDLGEI